MKKEEEKSLIEAAKQLLDSKGVTYKEVYIYEGCTEQCGKMPRFIVVQASLYAIPSAPVCYHLDELKEKLKDLSDTGGKAQLKSALEEIAEERARQDAKWGGPEHDDSHTPEEWLSFINDYINKAATNDYRKSLICIAALAIAAIESSDRKANDKRILGSCRSTRTSQRKS